MNGFSTYSDAEIQKWLHLRVIEWSGWPAFVSQPIVPILLVFCPWTHVLVVLIVDFLWCLVGYSVVSASLAKIGSLFVIVGKWPAAIGSCIYLGFQRNYVLAIVALLWPFLAGFVGAPARLFFGVIGIPRQIGKVELALAKQIGYVK